MGIVPWTPRRMWDPTDWIRHFPDDMNRFFERSLYPVSERRGEGLLFAPPVDILDEDNEVTVRTELPGLDKDQIKVSLMGNTLTIKGEKKSEKEDKNGEYYRRECTYGAFERVVELPDHVDTAKTDASFKNGVLAIRLKKKAEAKPKQIAVKVQ